MKIINRVIKVNDGINILKSYLFLIILFRANIVVMQIKLPFVMAAFYMSTAARSSPCGHSSIVFPSVLAASWI